MVSVFLYSISTLQAADDQRIIFEAARLVQHAKYGVAELDFSFKFQNEAGEPVAVDTLDSGCGCLKGTAMFESVAPGEVGEIRGKLLTENLHGTVVKSLWVTFSNGEKHELITEVTIPRGLVIEPSSLDWEQGGQADERKVEIRVESGQMLELQEVTCNLPQFEVRREDVERVHDKKVTNYSLALFLCLFISRLLDTNKP